MAQNFIDTIPDETTNILADAIKNVNNAKTLRSNFSGTTFPTTPVAGQTCFRTDEKKEYTFDGTAWLEIATTAYANAMVEDSIVNNVEDKAPSQNAVFDALALKAPLASPTFTGTVIVPDQPAGNNSTKAANTKYVDAGLGLKADLTYVEYLMMEGDPA